MKCKHNWNYMPDRDAEGHHTSLPWILCLFRNPEVYLKYFICSECGEIKEIARTVLK